MPEFTLTATTAAPVEEVWKLLFDPTRFPEWWAGIATARMEEVGAYTLWPDGHPDYAMPQQMRADRSAGRVAMSCKVNDIEFTWQLAEHGDGTGITVQVVIAPTSAHQLDRTREQLVASLPTLAALAEATVRGGSPVR
jgi:uncharacterized protein YndB with AHSA1/START domain